MRQDGEKGAVSVRHVGERLEVSLQKCTSIATAVLARMTVVAAWLPRAWSVRASARPGGSGS